MCGRICAVYKRNIISEQYYIKQQTILLRSAKSWMSLMLGVLVVMRRCMK